MEHVLKYLEVPIAFIKQLESFQSNCIAMQGVIERDIIDFGHISDYSFVEGPYLKGTVATGLGIFKFEVECGY
jgi:hypothetical protein